MHSSLQTGLAIHHMVWQRRKDTDTREVQDCYVLQHKLKKQRALLRVSRRNERTKRKKKKRDLDERSQSVIIRRGLCPIIILLDIIQRRSPRPVVSPPRGGTSPPLRTPAAPSSISSVTPIALSVPITPVVVSAVSVAVTVVSFGAAAGAARTRTLITFSARALGR